MAARKRTAAELEADRTRVLRLSLDGKSQTAIAAELGVSQQQVSRDLAAVYEEWKEAVPEAERGFLRNREMARLDYAEAEAWEQWHRSKQDARKTVSKIVQPTGAGGTEGAPRAETGEIVQGRLGDPRYLEVVLKCVERRCRILGLDGPIKVDPGKDLAEIAREAEEFLRGRERAGVPHGDWFK